MIGENVLLVLWTVAGSLAFCRQLHDQSSANKTWTPGHVKVRDCEPVQFDICRGLGYNVTGLPNMVGQESASDADIQLRTFMPLIQYGCSPELRFFLCAVYVPMCTEKVHDVIGPCRSVCERVQQRCQPVLSQFGFAWPPVLACSRFQPHNDNGHMCMEGALHTETGNETQRTLATLSTVTADPRIAIDQPDNDDIDTSSDDLETRKSCKHLTNPERFVYVNRSQSCALLCDENNAFNVEEKHLVDGWVPFWASVCLVSTVFVILTFLIDSRSFTYVEQLVVHLALCCGMCSVAYLTRAIAGRRAVACIRLSRGYNDGVDDDQPMILAEEGHISTDCTVVFVLLYYFAMAGAVWWVVLVLTWFLTAARCWSNERVRKFGTCHHVVAWTVPAVKTIIILVRKNIAPDELTGMCQLSSTNHTAFISYSLAPLTVYLSLGLMCLLVGWLGFCRSMHRRSSATSEYGSSGTDDSTTKEENVVLIRLGVFSSVCGAALAGLVAIQTFEYTRGDSLYQAAFSKASTNNTTTEVSRSLTVLLLAKIVISLIPGICAGLWMLCNNALRSWKCFLRRRLGIHSPVDDSIGRRVPVYPKCMKPGLLISPLMVASKKPLHCSERTIYRKMDIPVIAGTAVDHQDSSRLPRHQRSHRQKQMVI